MLLRKKATNEILGVSIPDLSGESFKLQWKDRQLSRLYDQLLREAAGGVLFIHPKNIIKPHRIDTVDDLLELAVDPKGVAPDSERKKVEPRNWDADKAPTQVQLVELLQAISSRDYFRSQFRIAVVVSAFDLLSGFHVTAEEFVRTELPFLKQYIDANSQSFIVRYYGVSAQGGRYASPEFLPEMIKDPKLLADRLLGGEILLTKWMRENLRSNVISDIQSLTEKKEQQQILAESLNEFLGRNDFYEARRFEGIALGEDTQTQLEEFQRKEIRNKAELMSLNRKLLEDAFPHELSRKWQDEREQAKLEKKHPAERVSVNGPNVVNEHDITEPLQWLMQ